MSSEFFGICVRVFFQSGCSARGYEAVNNQYINKWTRAVHLNVPFASSIGFFIKRLKKFQFYTVLIFIIYKFFCVCKRITKAKLLLWWYTSHNTAAITPLSVIKEKCPVCVVSLRCYCYFMKWTRKFHCTIEIKVQIRLHPNSFDIYCVQHTRYRDLYYSIILCYV